MATSAVPTSATGKIAACGLEHIDAPHLQRKKQVDYELTTSSRSRAVSTVKAANASSRPASSQTRGWHRERARPTTSRSRESREVVLRVIISKRVVFGTVDMWEAMRWFFSRFEGLTSPAPP